jgi:hypothetical protein
MLLQRRHSSYREIGPDVRLLQRNHKSVNGHHRERLGLLNPQNASIFF